MFITIIIITIYINYLLKYLYTLLNNFYLIIYVIILIK